MTATEPNPSDRANAHGAALMVGSMVAFTVNDAFMKVLGTQWPVFQSLFIRGIFAVLIMLGLAWALGHLRWNFSCRDWRMVAMRTGCEAVAAALFITAIFNMPLAEATAILQALPLTVTLAGALFLGEKVGWRRWLAIGVGFIGMLMIVRPSMSGVSPYALCAVAAVILITFRDLAARQMSDDVPSLLAAAVGALGVMLIGALGSTTEEWVPLNQVAAVGLVGAILTIGVAYFFSVAAMRSGDIGFVAPYRYSALLVALVIGYFAFDEVPDPLTLAGAALIMATGLYTLFRERQVSA